jgi:hypothetical protein
MARLPGTQAVAITPTGGAAAGLGLLVVAWPLAWVSGWAYVVVVPAVAAVLAAAFAGWRPGPALAVAAAVVACAFSRAGTAVLATEGLLIMAYLIVAHAPAGLTRPGPWLRQQAPGGVAGLIASGAVLAALTLHQLTSAWLTAAGLAAAAVAYLIALPSKGAAAQAPQQAAAQQATTPASPQAAAPTPGRDSDFDVQ